jgi:DNA-binding response OmpR family regulator
MYELRIPSEIALWHIRHITFHRKKSDILLLLMKNPDRVFSKEELVSRIRGEDDYETVWGMGYRIRAS